VHVTRYKNAKPYDAPGHHDVIGLRLQGHDVSPSRCCWVGLSHYLPEGHADSNVSDAEKIYVVLSGEITVMTDQGEVTLGVLDSCYLAAGERRSIVNRSTLPASMLVIMGYPPG